jgi:hypothetical protein
LFRTSDFEGEIRVFSFLWQSVLKGTMKLIVKTGFHFLGLIKLYSLVKSSYQIIRIVENMIKSLFRFASSVIDGWG